MKAHKPVVVTGGETGFDRWCRICGVGVEQVFSKNGRHKSVHSTSDKTVYPILGEDLKPLLAERTGRV